MVTWLQHKKIKECSEDIRKLRSELWELSFQSLKETPAEPWTLEDLENATKSLQHDQSRDPNNMKNNGGYYLKSLVLVSHRIDDLNEYNRSI